MTPLSVAYFRGRDSWFGQRKHHTLCIQRVHGLVDRLVESVTISKGLMREMMRFEVAPDRLDGA